MSERTRDAHFLFRIGPLGEAPERYFMYFLQPGDPEHPGAVGMDDRSALRKLIEVFPPASLVAEPALAEAAEELGIAVTPFDDSAAHALGLIALRMLPGEPLGELEREWTAFAMLRNARSLEARVAEARGEGDLRVILDFVGALRFRSFAILASSNGQPQTLSLFNSLQERERAAVAADDALAGAAPSGETCLGLRFRRDRRPVFNAIGDALNRAHGLHCIPEPIMIAGGTRRPATDDEILILAVTLDALAQVFQGRSRIESYTEVEGQGLGVRLTLE